MTGRTNERKEVKKQMNDKPKELKEHSAQIFELGCMERPVYLKEDVDAAIAELKQKLEDAKASAYADSVDAGMKNRRLKRALWLARSYRGRDNSILLPSKFMRNVWDNVERKCLAKAEQYK